MSMNDGGARVPGGTPAEVPADNRDAGDELPSPGGDTMPTPDSTPTAPDAPTPTPSETPKMGVDPRADRLSPEEIASNERGNDSLGTAIDLEIGGSESSTEAALKRATE